MPCHGHDHLPLHSTLKAKTSFHSNYPPLVALHSLLRETVIFGIFDINFGFSLGNFLQLSNCRMRKEFVVNEAREGVVYFCSIK